MGERFAGPVTLGHLEWQDAVAAELAARAPNLAGRIARLKRCGTAIVTRVCRGCGARDESTSVRSADCDLRICPRCARKRAQDRRLMVRAATQRLRRFRGKKWHFHTIPVPYDLEQGTSIDRLRSDFKTAWKAWKRLWRYLKKKLGALMGFASLEVSPRGLVHIHVLAWHKYNPNLADQRRVVMKALPPGASQYDVKAVATGKEQKGAIAELCKYLTKGVALDSRDGHKPEQTHPALAAMVEIAYLGRRCWRVYGGETADDMAAVEAPSWACPSCGCEHSQRTYDVHPTPEQLAAVDSQCWARAVGSERWVVAKRRRVSTPQTLSL